MRNLNKLITLSYQDSFITAAHISDFRMRVIQERINAGLRLKVCFTCFQVACDSFSRNKCVVYASQKAVLWTGEIFSFALRSVCRNASPSVQCEVSVGCHKKLLFLGNVGKQKKVGDSLSHLKLNLVQEVFKIFAKRKNLCIDFLLWPVILLRVTLEFF